MTNNSDLQAYIVQTIPFSHPAHVSKILPLLRQQALFNSFIASCIRPKTAKGKSNIFKTTIVQKLIVKYLEDNVISTIGIQNDNKSEVRL